MFRITMAHLPQNDHVVITVSVGAGQRTSLRFATHTWRDALEWLPQYLGIPLPAIPRFVDEQFTSQESVLLQFGESLEGLVSVELFHHRRKVAGVVSTSWSKALSAILSLIETPGLG